MDAIILEIYIQYSLNKNASVGLLVILLGLIYIQYSLNKNRVDR